MKWLKYLIILFLTLLSFGCMEAMFIASMSGRPCPNPPSVAWMVPEIKGQPDQRSDRRMSVQGTFAPKAEVIMSEQGMFGPKKISPSYTGGVSPPYIGGVSPPPVSPPRGVCWTTAGLPLDTLTEAVSTALAHAGLVQFVLSPEGGKYILQFEVERQSLTYNSDDPDLGRCTASVVVSYTVSVSGRKAPLWKDEIAGEHTIHYGFKAGPHYGSRSTETAAIEGAVAVNLSVLIRRLKDLSFDKD